MLLLRCAAKQLGFESFAAKYLKNKVLSSTLEVQRMLRETMDVLRPKVNEEMRRLIDFQRELQAIYTTHTSFL